MNKARIAFICLAVVAALSLGGVALASSLATPAIDWHVFSAAGAPAAGAQISLNGSLGQPIAGPARLGKRQLAGRLLAACSRQPVVPAVGVEVGC